MKLIIKEVYSNFRVDKNSKAIFVGMLQGVLEGQQLDTLDYFVVTDPEAGEFEKAVSKYAAIVGTEANVTRDGSYRAEGKTLSGFPNATVNALPMRKPRSVKAPVNARTNITVVAIKVTVMLFAYVLKT